MGKLCIQYQPDATRAPIDRTPARYHPMLGLGDTALRLNPIGGTMSASEAPRQRRKTRDIASLRDHVVICGFNHIGQVLASQSVKTG